MRISVCYKFQLSLTWLFLLLSDVWAENCSATKFNFQISIFSREPFTKTHAQIKAWSVVSATSKYIVCHCLKLTKARWLFLSHFWPLWIENYFLRQLVKNICSGLKTNYHSIQVCPNPWNAFYSASTQFFFFSDLLSILKFSFTFNGKKWNLSHSNNSFVTIIWKYVALFWNPAANKKVTQKTLK